MDMAGSWDSADVDVVVPLELDHRRQASSGPSSVVQ